MATILVTGANGQLGNEITHLSKEYGQHEFLMTDVDKLNITSLPQLKKLFNGSKSMQQKVSDFIAEYLVKRGISHVFMLTGGGAMHLNDSLGRHEKLQKIYNHHEQASAMAAESYARLTRKIPVVNVTTGPGGINTLNGVFGAWVDSLPILIISGQVKTQTTLSATALPLRQLGDQECDIVRMVKGITKSAVMLTNPEDVLYEFFNQDQFNLQYKIIVAHNKDITNADLNEMPPQQQLPQDKITQQPVYQPVPVTVIFS